MCYVHSRNAYVAITCNILRKLVRESTAEKVANIMLHVCYYEYEETFDEMSGMLFVRNTAVVCTAHICISC